MKQQIVFPEVSREPGGRPASCPHCGAAVMQRHQRRGRRLVDLKVKQVHTVQYRCARCRGFVTVRPAGAPPRCRHSARTKALSVVLWGLGLSLRDVSRVMTGLGVPISDVGVLKNVRALGELAVRRQQQVVGRVPVIGADETEVKLQGKGVTVGFLTDAASGQIVGIELLSSREGEQLGQWLAEAAQAFGAQVVVTDELASYKVATEAAGLDHQLCLAHVRKAVDLRLKKLAGFAEEKQIIRRALRELTPAAKQELTDLHQRFGRARPPGKGQHQSPAYALRMLTLELLENWGRLTLYQQTTEPFLDNLGRPIARRYTVPATNNVTENAIGRGGKLRAKRMRGFKRPDTIIPILMLIASLGGVLAGVPFHCLLN